MQIVDFLPRSSAFLFRWLNHVYNVCIRIVEACIQKGGPFLCIQKCVIYQGFRAVFGPNTLYT